MKRLIFCLIMFGAFASSADILLPRAEMEKAKRKYEQGLARCPKDKPLYDGEKCYSCNEPKTLYSGRGMKCSEICPNRYSTYECGSSCVLKNPPSSDYTYVQCRGWIPKCPSGTFQNPMDGECLTCDDIHFGMDGLDITEQECLSCPDTQYTDRGCYRKCPDNAPLLMFYGECETCDSLDLNRSDAVISGCEKCPNKVSVEYGSNHGCYQKCPKDKPLLGELTGKCFSCSEEDIMLQSNETWVFGCSKCPNKIAKVGCVNESEYRVISK